MPVSTSSGVCGQADTGYSAGQTKLSVTLWPKPAYALNCCISHCAAPDSGHSERYVTRPIPSYRYPPWQFHTDGAPVEHLAEILAVLREFGPFKREPKGLRRSTGWGEVEWLLSSHALLDGGSPAEMLAVDPARVLHAAHTEFISNL